MILPVPSQFVCFILFMKRYFKPNSYADIHKIPKCTGNKPMRMQSVAGTILRLFISTVLRMPWDRIVTDVQKLLFYQKYREKSHANFCKVIRGRAFVFLERG